MMFAVKVLVSALLIAAIAEIGRRNSLAAAFLAALPLVSIMAALWLYWETRDGLLVSRQLEATFWMVLPSLPMFLAVPAAVRAGISFPIALAGGVILTAGLFGLGLWLAARMGISL
jgi:hypothetical protein